jgi:hypothetical protein
LFQFDATNFTVKVSTTTQNGTISNGTQKMTAYGYNLEVPDKQAYTIDAQISINKNDIYFT